VTDVGPGGKPVEVERSTHRDGLTIRHLRARSAAQAGDDGGEKSCGT
jgi:hypothetical protein